MGKCHKRGAGRLFDKQEFYCLRPCVNIDFGFFFCLQQMRERLETLEDSLLCCICMSRLVGTVLCPCGHMTCSNCAHKISECPLCRTEVVRRQKVFLPNFSAHKEKSEEEEEESEESAGELV